MEQEYILARKSLLNFYKDVPLYYCTKDKKFVLYKSSGITLFDMRIEEGLCPDKLYIKHDDKIRGIQEVQKVFNQQLEKDVRSDNPEKVKETLLNIMEETLTEPKSGSLEGMSETMNIIVCEYAEHYDVIKNLLDVTSKDYTTTLHSINVMSLAIGYSFYINYSLTQKKILGLSALLHDVGKTKTNTKLLTMTEKLTEEEFKEMKLHTTNGYTILNNCKFNNKEIKFTALHHHERLDGSGYPYGMTKISETAQIIGLIDCYEALTNDDRPYRSAVDALKALTLIKKDVEAGRFDKKIFENFVYSLL
ncbi:MAG: HD domain-containing protein [Deltaproteobacteria bacterium]|nr:HD domain-containing protein [Deltaproteobacteria bacterium]